MAETKDQTREKSLSEADLAQAAGGAQLKMDVTEVRCGKCGTVNLFYTPLPGTEVPPPTMHNCTKCGAAVYFG